ncbi:GNAT family N-acetyltransferase [Flavobacterium sp.]|uniref:GNAT family N-acetyltransferase n=1 Tax=Flavobacterium sp. TaxID=239 RepID=UPI002B4B3C99|nr:GNAT family N-acetyltransferase [Flavobacterium sp.]HLF52147.1 GNAT family N-acetyltransferase [Flavobacterium sp.]
MQNIREIPSIETFSVRHPVLRAGKPIESCHFDGDDLETTRHFGFFQENNLIGVISIFKAQNKLFDEESQFQIRGMAVLEDHQKKGFGETLVRHAENYIKGQNGAMIWFNARIVAVGFYEKLGYQIIGDSFDIADVGEHYIQFKKIG